METYYDPADLAKFGEIGKDAPEHGRPRRDPRRAYEIGCGLDRNRGLTRVTGARSRGGRGPGRARGEGVLRTESVILPNRVGGRLLRTGFPGPGEGPRHAAARRTVLRAAVAMRPDAESLNAAVAAGILLHQVLGADR